MIPAEKPFGDFVKWTRWADKRPTDHMKQYRWRVSKRLILNMELQPEWTDKLHLCGVGYANEYWPSCSHWNGWQRTVDKTLEWREALPGETEITWNGLQLSPSPFTGRIPAVRYRPRYITAPPYEAESLYIKSFMIDDGAWTDAELMQNSWNSRSASIRVLEANFEKAKATLERLSKAPCTAATDCNDLPRDEMCAVCQLKDALNDLVHY